MNDYEIVIDDTANKTGSNLTKAQKKSVNKDFSRLVKKGAMSPDEMSDYAYQLEYATD